MRTSLDSGEKIEFLVREFYETAKTDATIGHFFTSVIAIDWDHHIPRICSFWESVLFQKHSFQGNPMLKHIELSRRSKISREHFDKWLSIWRATINDNFQGEKANEAIAKAEQIARLMEYKVEMNP